VLHALRLADRVVMSACPNCAIDLPPRHELPIFAADVLAERARLALVDPEGEHDRVAVLPRRFDWLANDWEPERVGWQFGATVPLDGVKARAVLLHLAEPGPVRLRVTGSGSDLNERDLLDRLGCDPTKDHGMVRCPAHEDRAASLSWRWDGERALLHDFAGCTFDEIRAAL
jgi:hypothetical protein